MHVWRSPQMINDFARSGYETLESRGREWRWQPALTLGWRVWFGD
jgi:hypothetical protein